MPVIRSIWDELADLETRFDEVFSASGRLARPLLPGPEGRLFIPAGDVFARNGDMVIRLDLPGIDAAKEITVEVEGDELVIRGERHRESKVERKDYYRKETYEGSFERHVALPKGMDASKIKADYHNGVLEVVVPGATKAEVKAKAQAIPVKVSAS
jgi:HSP20 family protein